jgi:hypothetical protein
VLDFDNARTGSEMAEILADQLDAVVGEMFGMAMWRTSTEKYRDVQEQVTV